MNAWPASVEVLIVGAGPVGLTLANALGQAGVGVLVVERNADLSDTPKAILIDDESFRTLQAIGLADAIVADVLYDYGARYFTSKGRCLARVRPTATEYGFARRSSFNQPELERRLLDGLARFANVDVRFNAELVALDNETGAVRVESNGAQTLTATWIIGCDGGRSRTRELCGINMSGLSFSERWLIIDTVNDPDDSRYTKFVCDPARPMVSVPAPRGARRYEFMLHAHEDAAAMTALGAVQQLLAPYRRITSDQIIRKAIYTFHAVMAERFRQGRVLLAGDAAHMMPPFAGQGMNTGIRDAHNLAWKLVANLQQGANDALLNTYALERRPHIQAMIDLSVFLGHVVMPTNRAQAMLRDAAFTALSVVPRFKRYITTMQWKPKPRLNEGFVIGASGGARLEGRMLPQPVVTLPSGGRARLDAALGRGFALIAADPIDPAALRNPLWTRIAAKPVRVLCDDRSPAPWDGDAVGDVQDQLKSALRAHVGEILLVRPDRYVAGAFAPADEDAFASAVETRLGFKSRESGRSRADIFEPAA